MTIEEMKKRKQELGYTNETIADLSHVPLGTVQKIFAGVTQHPRYDTLRALERVFTEQAWDMVRAPAIRYGAEIQNDDDTLKDYYQIPEDRRVELIDGVFYDMAAPSSLHQMLEMEIRDSLNSYIRANRGQCITLLSPVDVQLDCDNRTMVQPDLIVVCDRSKITYRCILGAPDMVVEVLSKATQRIDMFVKLNKYQMTGVREYWIVDPDKQKVIVYRFDQSFYPTIYGFDSKIPVGIFDDACLVDFPEIYERVRFLYEDERR